MNRCAFCVTHNVTVTCKKQNKLKYSVFVVLIKFTVHVLYLSTIRKDIFYNIAITTQDSLKLNHIQLVTFL